MHIQTGDRSSLVGTAGRPGQGVEAQALEAAAHHLDGRSVMERGKGASPPPGRELLEIDARNRRRSDEQTAARGTD